jgi:hypothetical protein
MLFDRLHLTGNDEIHFHHCLVVSLVHFVTSQKMLETVNMLYVLEFWSNLVASTVKDDFECFWSGAWSDVKRNK